MPQKIESWKILWEKEDYVIYQSNNVGSPITFFVSFSCFLFVQFDNSMNVVNYKVLGIKIIRNSFIRASLLIHTLLWDNTDTPAVICHALSGFVIDNNICQHSDFSQPFRDNAIFQRGALQRIHQFIETFGDFRYRQGRLWIRKPFKLLCSGNDFYFGHVETSC